VISTEGDIPLSVLVRLPKSALLEDLPLSAQQEVRRILDAEARRLLSEAVSDDSDVSPQGASPTRIVTGQA
jgi:hypothetical protein